MSSNLVKNEELVEPNNLDVLRTKKPIISTLKRVFIMTLIGSLVVSGLVAAYTVLVGEFSEVTIRVIFTLLMVVLHSLISLMFIWDDERQNTFERLAFFIDVLFCLIILSFFTAIFGIWKIIDGMMVFRLYQTYFVLGFASLHGDILSKALEKEKYMDLIIYINYLFMAVVVMMLLPIIFVENSYLVLGEIYYRILGAVGIVDGTLSILTIILYKMYANKHPHEKELIGTSLSGGAVVKRGLSGWVWVLAMFLLMQIVSSIMSMLTSMMY